MFDTSQVVMIILHSLHLTIQKCTTIFEVQISVILMISAQISHSGFSLWDRSHGPNTLIQCSVLNAPASCEHKQYAGKHQKPK